MVSGVFGATVRLDPQSVQNHLLLCLKSCQVWTDKGMPTKQVVIRFLGSSQVRPTCKTIVGTPPDALPERCYSCNTNANVRLYTRKLLRVPRRLSLYISTFDPDLQQSRACIARGVCSQPSQQHACECYSGASVELAEQNSLRTVAIRANPASSGGTYKHEASGWCYLRQAGPLEKVQKGEKPTHCPGRSGSALELYGPPFPTERKFSPLTPLQFPTTPATPALS